MIQVNIVALTHLTKLLVRKMVASKSGRVLNVASTAAFQPGPLMAVYYATKAYVLSFSEALANELARQRRDRDRALPGADQDRLPGARADGGVEAGARQGDHDRRRRWRAPATPG